MTLGIDKGSSVRGIACVANGRVLLAAEIQHRRDVKDRYVKQINSIYSAGRLAFKRVKGEPPFDT